MIHRGSEARAAKAIRKGAEVNWVDAEGKTPLHYAAKQGELCLLPFGEPLSCMLICMCCAGSGHVHVVYLLLEHKADVNQRSEVMVAALREAMACPFYVGFFRCQGNGDTPILKAVKNGHMDVCLALIQHKADVRIRPRVRATCLLDPHSWLSLNRCTRRGT